jgi:hypothetical protein
MEWKGGAKPFDSVCSTDMHLECRVNAMAGTMNWGQCGKYGNSLIPG